MIDGEDKPDDIRKFFNDRGVTSQGFGNGISIINSVLGPKVRPSMEQVCQRRAALGEPKFIYVWTVDAEDDEKEYLRIGVDGIIVDYETDVEMMHVGNQLKRFKEFLDGSEEFKSVVRYANRDDDPFNPPNNNYGLTVKTGDEGHAGTDANVTFTLTGANGSASVTVNTQLPHRMERNDENYVTLQCSDLGALQSITVSRDDQGNAPDWYVDSIEVASARYGVTPKTAVFQQWIDKANTPFTKPLA